MKRREFVAAAGLAGLAPLTGLAAAEDAKAPAGKDYYELRLYRLASAEKKRALCKFFDAAAVPAFNRIGVSPVGVFEFAEEGNNDLYVLLPHRSIESFATARSRLLADAKYFKDGAAVLDAPADDPAYERIESSLMVAFDGHPRLDRPAKSDARVFQLRTYESHSAKKGQKKIEMFNTGGELAVFHETGLTPVFFGESLIGTKLPNLTYMLGFESMDANKAAWGRFLKSPGWSKLKSDPAYKNTVSNITNIFLRPAACSQI